MVCLAGATLFTALSTTQSYASRLIENLSASWVRMLPIQAIDWYSWGILAPFVIATAASLPWRVGERSRLALIWIGAAIGFCIVHNLSEVIIARATGVVSASMPFGRMLSARFTATMAPNLIVFGGLVLAYYAAAHYRELQQREQRARRLEVQLAEAQLEVLRRQLQPHFLFNALHTVSALISEDTGAARRVLSRLGELLRLSLDHAESHEVTLRAELNFLDNYLDIQRMRFRDRLTVEIDVASDAESARVPTLLLQPLVENAIRYAIEPRAAAGRIEISAWRDGDTLKIAIRDDGPGIVECSTPAHGIGLANTRRRLEQLYGERQSLTLSNDDRGGLSVEVALPFCAI
jgi:two-component system LytT family sensor kinase